MGTEELVLFSWLSSLGASAVIILLAMLEVGDLLLFSLFIRF